MPGKQNARAPRNIAGASSIAGSLDGAWGLLEGPWGSLGVFGRSLGSLGTALAGVMRTTDSR